MRNITNSVPLHSKTIHICYCSPGLKTCSDSHLFSERWGMPGGTYTILIIVPLVVCQGSKSTILFLHIPVVQCLEQPRMEAEIISAGGQFYLWHPKINNGVILYSTFETSVWMAQNMAYPLGWQSNNSPTISLCSFDGHTMDTLLTLCQCISEAAATIARVKHQMG